MEWIDDALVIGLRHHGETAVIAELLTQEHGRQKGYVHGGRSRRLRPVLQPGNGVRAQWQSRQDDGLGTLSLEPTQLRAAAIMDSALALHGSGYICALLRLLPEREPHGLLFAMAGAILDHLDDHFGAAQGVVRFELALLRDLGFGLDFSQCALTGAVDDLAYVSPRTGRAVTRAAGEAYRDRALVLPRFLVADDHAVGAVDELAAGFVLTEHFLKRDLFAPRGLAMPDSRDAYLDAISRAVARSDSAV